MSEHELLKQVEAAAILRQSLAAITDDEDALRDTIEGQTTLHEMIVSVAASIAQDEELLTGIKVRAEDLSARKFRIESRVDRKRALIEQAMSVGEIRTLELAECTLSLKSKPKGLIVENEADVPSKYWAPQPPKLDRKALTAALRDGQEVPGASLDNGGISLTIRRK